MEVFDYKTERSENTILINTKNWLKNDSNLIQEYRISGKAVINGLTEVLDVYDFLPPLQGYLKKGDKVLLSKVASQISNYYAYAINGKKEYHSIPIMQVLGVFKDGHISLDSLSMLFDKILIKKINPRYNTYLDLPEDNTTVGVVIKTGNKRFNSKWEEQPLTVKEGDVVLIRDNVSTPINFEGEEYLATEEGMVVGVFENKEALNIDGLRVLNKYILMKPFTFSNLLNSNLLITPNINYADLDYSDVYNPNLFIVLYMDEKLTFVKKYDIVIVDRNITNYVYFNNDRYFVINDESSVEGVWQQTLDE